MFFSPYFISSFPSLSSQVSVCSSTNLLTDPFPL
jgi:exosome complex component RRP40